MSKKILLIKGEQIVYESKYHWAHYLSPFGLVSGFIVPLLRDLRDEFVITNLRVIVLRSLPPRELEIHLQKISTVQVRQHFVGKLLGFGTIIVTGTGNRTDRLLYIKNPEGFYEAFNRQLDNKPDVPNEGTV
jgi:hypothetical protein